MDGQDGVFFDVTGMFTIKTPLFPVSTSEDPGNIVSTRNKDIVVVDHTYFVEPESLRSVFN